MSIGTQVTHIQPWSPNVTVAVPGGDRKWTPEEVGSAVNTSVFQTRHPGLRALLEASRRP
jgi:hypothetical protein